MIELNGIKSVLSGEVVSLADRSMDSLNVFKWKELVKSIESSLKLNSFI